MSNNVIETHDLTVYYGKHRGILNVNLMVEQGEVFGFLGPNGAGKTTTQRVLLDVFPPHCRKCKDIRFRLPGSGRRNSQTDWIPAW